MSSTSIKIHQGSNHAEQPVLTNAQLNQLFTEALIVSVALGHTRGDRLEKKGPSSGPSLTSIPLPDSDKRVFLDSLAYLCDYEQHGKSVTAVALEQTNGGLLYRFAPNNNECSMKTEEFLTTILRKLKNATRLRYDRLLEELLTIVFKQNSPRIERYASRLEESINALIKHLTAIAAAQGTTLSELQLLVTRTKNCRSTPSRSTRGSRKRNPQTEKSL